MNKFRNVPAIITLLAGFITSVIMIIHRYPLVNFMWVLVSIMLAFYASGVLIRFALNKVVQKKNDKEDEKSHDEGDSDILDENNADNNGKTNQDN